MIRAWSVLPLSVAKLLPHAAMGGIAIAALAACSAGITSGSSVSSVPTKPVSGGSTITLAAPLGSFPIPRGATVLQSVVAANGYSITLGNVTATAADSFYSTALPTDGFVIGQHQSASGSGASGTGMLFTGHGYKGEIATINLADPSALASFAGMPSLPASLGTTITGDGITGGALVIVLARQ
jgi:hypothetical protein